MDRHCTVVFGALILLIGTRGETPTGFNSGVPFQLLATILNGRRSKDLTEACPGVYVLPDRAGTWYDLPQGDADNGGEQTSQVRMTWEVW